MIRYLALEAGAGSGKTFALTTRFIALVLGGANVREITSLTFTKKAASEMKSRIVETFLNLEKPKMKSELDAICQMLALSSEKIIALRDKNLEDLLNCDLKISTFDSFFSMILRSFALHCGLSPDFGVDEGIKTVQREMFVEEIAKNPLLLKDLGAYLEEFGLGLDKFFEYLEIYESNALNLSIQNLGFPDESRVFEAVKKMHDYAVSKNATDKILKSFNPSQIKELMDRAFIKKESLDDKTHCKIYSTYLDMLFFDLKDELKSYFSKLESYNIAKIAKFFSVYEDVKKRINKRENLLSFSDISTATYALLSKNMDPEILYFRLDSRINHLLIDEFQDTNRLQYEVIKPLIEEIVSGFGQNGLGSFFYVGDTKQSIYRFRGGTKELFDELLASYPQMTKHSLDKNYRSKECIVNFVNSTFSDKFSGYIPQISSKTGGYVSAKTSKKESLVTVLEEVKRVINAGVIPSEIAILCWKNENVTQISLMLEEHGIKTDSQGGLKLIQNQAVRAIIEYAKYCVTKEEIYKANLQSLITCRANLLSIDLDKSVISTLYYLAKELEISICEPDMILFFAEAVKFNNIIEFALNADKIETLSSKKSANGVVVMTVHKSKGLQFEHVLVCDMLGRSNSSSNGFLIDNFKLYQKIKNKEHVDENYAKILEKDKNLDFQESINKLYVAFTRAKSSLLIIKQLEPNGNNPSYFSPFISNEQEIAYLDIKDFEEGEICPSKSLAPKMAPDTVIINKAHIQPQNLKKPADDDGDIYQKYFGTALHYLLELNSGFESIGKFAKLALKNRFEKYLNAKDLDEIIKRVEMLYKNSEFLNLVVGKTALKEQTYIYNGRQKRLDLLLYDEKEIIIVDYKSSLFLNKAHENQICEYKSQISAIYPNLSVKAKIIYLKESEITIVEV